MYRGWHRRWRNRARTTTKCPRDAWHEGCASNPPWSERPGTGKAHRRRCHGWRTVFAQRFGCRTSYPCTHGPQPIADQHSCFVYPSNTRSVDGSRDRWSTAVGWEEDGAAGTVNAFIVDCVPAALFTVNELGRLDIPLVFRLHAIFLSIPHNLYTAYHQRSNTPHAHLPQFIDQHTTIRSTPHPRTEFLVYYIYT